MMIQDRIRFAPLLDRIVSAEAASHYIKDGMTVGISGFTRAGDAKLVLHELARRAAAEPLRITLMSGASLGHDTDKILAEAGVLARRIPFQVDTTLRRKINSGDVMFIDQHLGETVEQLRSGSLHPVDVAVIEVAAVTAEGHLVPTTSVGNSVIFAQQARQIILEVNHRVPLAIEGIHDIYQTADRPERLPIQITHPCDRVGGTSIPVDPSRIVAVVETDLEDTSASIEPPDEATSCISLHLTEFLLREVERGKLTHRLLPLQAGIGTVANAVLTGFISSPFHELTMYSEVLQDSAFELIDAGKLLCASACSITLSERWSRRFLENLDHYRDFIVLRPQEISNSPGIVRRMGIIGINTALEVDIYGNINSTHVNGTHMMNGIGGSGDFARNAQLSIFVTSSLARKGDISCVVPMVPHVDSNEHDVDVIVTEQGYADLRGLAPRERAPLIISRCAHPTYREALYAYVEAANRLGGHTPHVLEKALQWHITARDTGSMRAWATASIACSSAEPVQRLASATGVPDPKTEFFSTLSLKPH
jgi:succinyl-CoA:acetate CoA-transferase